MKRAMSGVTSCKYFAQYSPATNPGASSVASLVDHLMLHPVPTEALTALRSNANHLLTRVNRRLILWLAARRQGRSALLPFGFHLDDARFAKIPMAIKDSRRKCHGR